jgi:hypothetical protein
MIDARGTASSMHSQAMIAPGLTAPPAEESNVTFFAAK